MHPDATTTSGVAVKHHKRPGRVEAGWVDGRVKQTGPSPRRPLLTSHTKAKVNADLLKRNLKLRSVNLFESGLDNTTQSPE